MQQRYFVKWKNLEYAQASWEDKLLMQQLPTFSIELSRFRARAERRDLQRVRRK